MKGDVRQKSVILAQNNSVSEVWFQGNNKKPKNDIPHGSRAVKT
jgi:hypothetical protein